MARYRIQEGTFDLPDSLHDQTVNVFTLTPSGPSPFNIVLTRARAVAGRSLADHVSGEIRTLERTLKDFALLWRRDHQVDGHPAEITAATLGRGDDAMEQRQLFLLTGERALTLTASARGGFSAEQLDMLNALVASLHLAGR